MNNTFLGISTRRQGQLREAQIPFETFRMGNQNGIIFDDGNLPRLLETLASRIERQEDSPYEGIRVIHIKRGRGNTAVRAPIAPATVAVEHWSRDSNDAVRQAFVDVAGEFSTAFGGVTEIILVDCCSRGRDPHPPRTVPGTFHVFLWSAASGRSHDNGDDGKYAAAELWGYRIAEQPGQWRHWHPSGQGTVIKDDAETEIAELVGNNLYVLYPINSSSGGRIPLENARQIFRKILEAASLLRGATPEEIEQRRLEGERQREELLRAEVEREPVIIKRWDGRDALKNRFLSVAQEFVQPLGGKPIWLHDYSDSARQHRPAKDGRTHICIYASSGEIHPDGCMQKMLFGAPLTWEDISTVLFPSEEIGALLADEDGNQVGMVEGDTIYIHYQLANRYVNLTWDKKGPEALFRRILEEAVFMRTATEQEKAARMREIAQRNRAQTEEAYVKACSGRFDQLLKENKKIVENNPSKVRDLQLKIVKLIREAQEAEVRLRDTETHRAEHFESYKRELKKLYEIPQVLDVRANDSVIKVFTDTLCCVDPRSQVRHEIGKFRIEMHLDGTIRWFNLTRKVCDMNAPHVFSDGHACLGNLDEVIPQLAANYEFAALAMIAIQMIETVNVDDSAGTKIKHWPVAA